MKLTTRLYAPEDGSSAGGGGTILAESAPQQQQPVQQQSSLPPEGSAPTNTAFDFRSVIGDGGAFKEGWINQLPDDLKPYGSTLGKYPNVVEMLRGHGNAQKLLGQKSQPLKPPGPDATPEQRAEWRKIVGVPDSPDAYGFKKPEKLPEGLDWNDEQAKEFAKLAHELDVTPAQAEKLISYHLDKMSGMVKNGQEQLTAWKEQQRDELKKEWGDKYDNQIQRAIKAAEWCGIDPNDAELGNSAKMIRSFAKVAELLSEDKFIGPDKTGIGMTGPDAAEDIRRNPNNPWHNAYHGKEGKDRQWAAAQHMMRLQGVKMT